MKRINNFINEKLYIGKGFKTDIKVYDELISFLKNNECNLVKMAFNNETHVSQKGKKFPYIELRPFEDNDELFLIGGQFDTNLDIVPLITKETKDSNGFRVSSSSIEYNSEKEGFESTMVGRRKAYNVSLNNAKIILDIISREKE